MKHSTMNFQIQVLLFRKIQLRLTCSRGCGTSQRATKSGAVISGDMILASKHVWTQVAATLRSPFRQKGSTSARSFHSQHDDAR